jgi:hypothetical protein
MNHQSILSYQSKRNEDPRGNDKAPNCTGQLDPDGGGFWDDIRWTVYKCRGCGQRIAAVGGFAHWWNYVLPPEKPQEVQS